jgi:hypothetical protein
MLKCNICHINNITHIRKSLCGECYALERKDRWQKNDSLRKKNLLYKEECLLKKRQRHIPKLYSYKICPCGQQVPKQMRSVSCKECSQKNSYKNKIKYQLNRKKNHLPTKIRENMKSRLQFLFNTCAKNSSIIKYLDCSIHKLKIHLQMKFHRHSRGKHEYMTWSNYGEWHIDHIKPLAAFDLSDPSQQALACHYTNLQPLWAKDNFKKGSKYEL